MTYVSHEGVESTQHGPTGTQSLGSVTAESTDICTDHGDLEDRSHGEDTRDTVTVVLPVTEVVTEPLANLRTSAGEGRTSDDKGAAARATRQHCVVGGSRHHGSVQVV